MWPQKYHQSQHILYLTISLLQISLANKLLNNTESWSWEAALLSNPHILVYVPCHWVAASYISPESQDPWLGFPSLQPPLSSSSIPVINNISDELETNYQCLWQPCFTVTGQFCSRSHSFNKYLLATDYGCKWKDYQVFMAVQCNPYALQSRV